jgi:hypothetical protein
MLEMLGNMTSKDLIRAVGEACGGRITGSRIWRITSGSAIRPLRRWAAGEVEPPPGIWRELARHPSLGNSGRQSAAPAMRSEMIDRIAQKRWICLLFCR